MTTIVLISIGLITISHRLILPFRKTGTIRYETAYDIFSFIMHITVFTNLIILFQWIGLGIAAILNFIGGYLSVPLGLIIYKTDLQPDELLLIFAILSWINIILTIIHIILFIT
ncbi:MAG: hypothetical protein HXY50_03415 [Ignavibacteriaceae bacterium]|nr:hypothetical protein [Ignavibacteriaceae bacterium]